MILFSLIAVTVLIPVVGLAIDGSIVFWAKAKLTTALDSAALAAGRSPSADANEVAQQYVFANLPPGWMGSTYSAPPIALIDYPSPGVRRVTVSAALSVPMHFLRILRFNSSTVSNSASTVRRNSNIMMVLDRSSSMNAIGADGNPICSTMRAAAQTFVSFFTDGQDQLGLVSFNVFASLDYPFTPYFKSSNPSLVSTLGDLTCGSNTASAQALELAYQQIKNLGPSAYASTGTVNVIVFMTDGFPNGVTLGPGVDPASNFVPKDQTDDRYCPASPAVLCPNTPATSAACQNELASAGPGTVAQWAGGNFFTGPTTGPFQAYPNGNPPASTCASGNRRAICTNYNATVATANCAFYSQVNYVRNDLAYIPGKDVYGNPTVNTSYMTQPSDIVPTGPYAGLGGRLDSPQAVVNASFNVADAEALKVISDSNFKPVILVIGLGGASDLTNVTMFSRFLHRVANDSASDRYDPNLPVGTFIYSPNDTQLQSAFRQVASLALRLSK